MGEDLNIPHQISIEEKRALILKQVVALIANENDQIANLANVVAVLKEAFNHLWCGFYLVKGNELVLGPFQGPLACTRIAKGKGVCGRSWELKQSILVDDVEQFPGHIACSSLSRSELVVPIIKNGKVLGVLDLDNKDLAAYDKDDMIFYESLCNLLVKHCFN